MTKYEKLIIQDAFLCFLSFTVPPTILGVMLCGFTNQALYGFLIGLVPFTILVISNLTDKSGT